MTSGRLKLQYALPQEPLTDVFLASPAGGEYSDADPLSSLRPCQSGGVLRIWARLKAPHTLGLDSAAVYGSFLRRKVRQQLCWW